MSALITCAGADLLKGHVSLPQTGPWTAVLELDTTTVPSGQVTLAADGGLSLKGFVLRAGADLQDRMHVRLVGGAGGLSKIVPPAAWQGATVRDPLNAIMSATGESLSSTIDASITGLVQQLWTVAAQSGAACLNLICYAAGQVLGKAIGWRILGDGTVWIGAETWPAQAMPDGADILRQFPGAGRYEIGAQTPSLLPGVNLTGVGNVAAVEHWLSPSEVRTWAWVA